MSGYDDSQLESGNQYHEVHKKCDSLLQYIDFKHETNRQWIAKSYRKLTQFLQENSTSKFNLTPNSHQLPNLATKYAYQIKPFPYDQGLQHRSKQMEEFYAARKKCEMPLIYKSDKNQFVLLEIQNGSILIKENNKFNLKIQAQQKSTIVITYQSNHPLRTKQQLVTNHYQKVNLQIIPPCVVSVCVIKQTSYTQITPQNVQISTIVPFKIPSNAVKIEVINTGVSKKGRLNDGIGWLDNMMVRPEETFENLYSNSQNSQAHQYIGIQTESRSRD